jgi:plastocyanin
VDKGLENVASLILFSLPSSIVLSLLLNGFTIFCLAMFVTSLALALFPFVSAAVHDIQVGKGGLVFSPEAIFAQPGDQVVFHFTAKNHTATQSSFAGPCTLKDGGFDSGFMPVAAGQTDNLPTYTITVNDAQPIWMYCRQAAKTPASHCGQGMVFAVNCGPDGAPNSFTNFKKAALAEGAKLAAAASSTAAPPAWTTAAYGDYTIPPAPESTPVTQTVSLSDKVWTTTYDSYPGSPDPTPAALEGKVHTVIVGGPGKLTFEPSQLAAQPRDVVVFEFRQKNHTVTQSTFADPCRKMSASGATGFDSGFFPVAADLTSGFPTWNLTINDTAPIWGYCRQQVPASHCGAGMVFAINSVESSDRNFTAFQNVAKALNGTSASSNSPPPTQPNNGASSIHVGGFTLVAAVLVAALA